MGRRVHLFLLVLDLQFPFQIVDGGGKNSFKLRIVRIIEMERGYYFYYFVFSFGVSK